MIQKVALPKEIPKGLLFPPPHRETFSQTFSLIAKFSIAVRGYTVEDDDMLCVDIRLDFMRHFLQAGNGYTSHET